MAGIGSGRRSNRATTDDCLRISLSHLKRLGMVKRHWMHRQTVSWSRNGRTVTQLTFVSDVECMEPYPCLKITGDAHGRRIDCLVRLESRPLHFGGERWYALCSNTGRRCTTLVLPPGETHFASVSGWGLSYGSQREGEVGRAMRAMHRIEERLSTLSKYTRKPTRSALHEKWVAAHEIYDQWEERIMRDW